MTALRYFSMPYKFKMWTYCQCRWFSSGLVAPPSNLTPVEFILWWCGIAAARAMVQDGFLKIGCVSQALQPAAHHFCVNAILSTILGSTVCIHTWGNGQIWVFDWQWTDTDLKTSVRVWLWTPYKLVKIAASLNSPMPHIISVRPSVIHF